MERTASTIAAALLTVWALVAITQQRQPLPAAATTQQRQPLPAAATTQQRQPLPAAATTPAPLVAAPAAPSALGDFRTLSRYPGN